MLLTQKTFCIVLALSLFVMLTSLTACNSDEDKADGDMDLISESEADTEINPDGDLDTERDLADTELDFENELEKIESEIEIEAEKEIERELKCNGYASLCEKKYNEVSYITTHNSMAAEENKDEEGWLFPNHKYNITTQLADGVTGFMLDTHYCKASEANCTEGEAYLCHGECMFGANLLSDGLLELKTFMDKNKGAVLTIIFESYIDAKDTNAAFVTSGLIDYVYIPQNGQTWPTLKEMIEANTRIVVLADDQGADYPWYLNVWDYAWDTDYDNHSWDDFSCNKLRGNKDNALFILNHFIYGALSLPSKDQSEIANANPEFLERANLCWTESTKQPNFVTVDFYSIGDVIDVVNSLNQVD